MDPVLHVNITGLTEPGSGPPSKRLRKELIIPSGKNHTVAQPK